MRWQIYTRSVALDGGVGLRWFWSCTTRRGTRESTAYVSRQDCEQDARQHGLPAAEVTELYAGMFKAPEHRLNTRRRV